MTIKNEQLNSTNEDNGSGSAGAEGQAGGKKGVVDNNGGDDVASLKAQIDALTKKNSEILGEKKKFQSELETLKKQATSQTLEDAEKNGDYKKALELTRQELGALKEEIEKAKVVEAEEMKKVVKEKMVETFKNALPGKLVNEKLLSQVEWDKYFVRDPEAKDGIKFVDAGVKQAVEQFQKDFGDVAFVKDDKAVPSQTKAKGGTKGSGDSIADWIRKNNLVP